MRGRPVEGRGTSVAGHGGWAHGRQNPWSWQAVERQAVADRGPWPLNFCGRQRHGDITTNRQQQNHVVRTSGPRTDSRAASLGCRQRQ
jgi:hypothetical protein